jgi:PAS domain S-box-containing protein
MGIPLRVLIVEDSEDDALLLLRELRSGGYEPISKRVDTPEAMSAELDGATWDIVISDYVMPQFNGLEALKLMRRKGLDPPFIIISGKADEDTLVRAMKAGVHDYILKKNLARLTPAVERELREAAVRRERIKAEEDLRESGRKFRFITENISDLVAQMSTDGRYVYVSPSYRKTLGYDPASLLGKSGNKCVHPEDRKRLVEAINKGTAQKEDELKLEYRLRHQSGEYRWLEGTVKLLYDEEGNFSKIQLNSRDITDRKEMEEALRKSEEEARRLAEENSVMAGIGRIISSTLDIDTVYERFSKEVRRIVHFDRITINIIDYQKNTLTILYTSGLNVPGHRKGEPISVAGTATEEVMQTKRPLLIREDEETHKRIPGLLPFFLAGGKSFMLIPMISQDKVIGALSFLSTQPEAYTEKELRVAEEVGNQIAGAIANAQMFRSISKHRKELRALTIRLQEVEEAERRRLTRELHDRVGPNLTALSINLNIILKQLAAESSGKVGIRLEDSLRLLEETALHIRDVMAELRPPVLDDYGLLAALQWYGEQFAERTGVIFVIQGAEATPRLPLPLEAALFRISQEALTNVARHARAGQVTVTLEEVAQEVRLTIADDGTGFEFSEKSETRSAWGLISMRERAEAVGGRFQVKSAPGKGTRIMVAVRR